MQRKVIAIIASVVLLVSAVSLWRTFRSGSDSFEKTPFIGIGQVLAEETAKAIQDRGQLVAVMNSESEQSGTAAQLVWEAFQKEVTKHPGIQIAATEQIPLESAEPTPGCSVPGFLDILDRHAHVDAIVFFVGIPDWRALKTKINLSQPIAPKIIARGEAPVSPRFHYEGYFANQVLSALILRRWAPSPETVADPKTPRERFNNEFQVFTPENFQTLPE